MTIELFETLAALAGCVHMEGRPYGLADADAALAALEALGLVECTHRLPNGVEGDFWAPTALGNEYVERLLNAARYLI